MRAPSCDVDYRAYAAREVKWYRKNGQHFGSRVRRDRDGVRYVIGDWAWNRGGRPVEYVERSMHYDLLNKLSGAQP